MKKILLALIGMVMAVSASAANIEEGKQYTVLNKPATEHPQVIEFFSFYCGACFQFDQRYHISKKIKESLPENVEYHKYHVSFMGGEVGMMLTQAWGIAMIKDMEEEVKPLIFEGVQIKRNINGLKDIRDIFIKAGLPGEEFDSLWDSFVVKSLLSKQLSEAQNLELNAVPAIYANGKYQVKLDGVESIDDFVTITKYLALEK
jgi:thiol:disulfide interchange protein DsbA